MLCERPDKAIFNMCSTMHIVWALQKWRMSWWVRKTTHFFQLVKQNRMLDNKLLRTGTYDTLVSYQSPHTVWVQWLKSFMPTQFSKHPQPNNAVVIINAPKIFVDCETMSTMSTMPQNGIKWQKKDPEEEIMSREDENVRNNRRW